MNIDEKQTVIQTEDRLAIKNDDREKIGVDDKLIGDDKLVPPENKEPEEKIEIPY